MNKCLCVEDSRIKIGELPPAIQSFTYYIQTFFGTLIEPYAAEFLDERTSNTERG
jgi:hypothetical protein